MGWKAVKDHYKIEHIVCVEDGDVCIGSPYVHDILKITPSGEIIQRFETDNKDLCRYVEEMKADKDLLLSLIRSEDVFPNSIKIYGVINSEVVEDYCENLGWPNVTHSGCIQYEGSFFTSLEEANAKCKKEIESYISEYEKMIFRKKEEIQSLENDMQELKRKLEKCRCQTI